MASSVPINACWLGDRVASLAMAASRLALFRLSSVFSEFSCFVPAVLADPCFAPQFRDAWRSWFALITYCWKEVRAWSGVMPGGRYWSAAEVLPGCRALSTSAERV